MNAVPSTESCCPELDHCVWFTSGKGIPKRIVKFAPLGVCYLLHLVECCHTKTGGLKVL